MNKTRHKNTGFSLVELMVAMTIGLLLMIGISTVFVGTKRNYTVQDSLARMQENGRLAMQIMTREIRGAGYLGCFPDEDNIENKLTDATSGFGPYNQSIPIQGANNSLFLLPGSTALPSGAIAGTDAIAIRRIDASGSFQLNASMPNTSATLDIDVGSGIGIVPGDILMIADCSGGSIFEVTGPAVGSNGDLRDASTLNHNGAGLNEDGWLQKMYDTDAKISKFIYAVYFIGTGASGEPALFRLENEGTAVELVEGIESMEILYGVNVDTDSAPDYYLQAGETIYSGTTISLTSVSDWKRVKSVRIGVVARALASKTTTSSKQSDIKNPNLTAMDVDGDGTDDFFPSAASVVTDRYHRRVFRTTLLLRNM